MFNKKLVLENGMVFEGVGFGANTEMVADIVFNTAVVGYQEVLSDPSNVNTIVCMGYPLIGNYGMTDEDYESARITISGLIVREYNDVPSNFRFTRTLGEVMEENNVPGIAEVDTREIVRVIRDSGVMRAIICDIAKPMDECMAAIKGYVAPANPVEQASTKKVWYARTVNPTYNVVCIDCGIKRSLVILLKELGSNVVVVPYNTPVEKILKYKPTGVFISDGPGNPENVTDVVDTIKELKGKVPMLGVGLGQELIGLAYGAKIAKQKVGHNGCNIPVRNLATNKIEITNQNDQYELVVESLENTGLAITHKNVIDGIVAGVEDKDNCVIGVQYNPAPTESEDYVFARFEKLMKNFGGKR